jgi:5-methylthioadenosine/S-adenosylhomocysteine deaminase
VSGPDIENGTVVVEGERIIFAGARSSAPPGRDVELGDVILGPGLVNAHTHLDLTVLRGRFNGLTFFAWIRALTAARAGLSPAQLLASARDGIREGIRAGITTYADTAPNDAPFEAMLGLGVRGIAYREVFGPDPTQCEASMIALREMIAPMRARETPLVSCGVSPHAPYSVSDDLFAAVAVFASAERLPLATHVAESLDESRLIAAGEGDFAGFLQGRGIAVAPRGRTPVDMLERNGVLGAHALLIHCVRCDDADIATILKHRCGVATCPVSNAMLGHGPARVQAMLLEDVRVGVGTDSMASNERMDVLAESRLALGARCTERAAWELATLGGARALGLDHVIGTLQAGKQADLAAFPIDAGPGVPSRASFVAVAGKRLIDPHD